MLSLLAHVAVNFDWLAGFYWHPTDTLDKTKSRRGPTLPRLSGLKESQVVLLRRVGCWRGKTQNDLELRCLLLADSVPSLAQIHLSIIAVFQRVLLWTQAEKSQV